MTPTAITQNPKSDITANLLELRKRIQNACVKAQRSEDSLTLLAVSKYHPLKAIQQAIALKQYHFGENYLQEALDKIEALRKEEIQKKIHWHFIGPIQRNKTANISKHFDWVHTVDRLLIAERLNCQRPDEHSPLNLCIQVNVSNEPQKSGISLSELPSLAKKIQQLPKLRLRGLMMIPALKQSERYRSEPFTLLRDALDRLNQEGFNLDTLSMGMSHDLETAIASGATTLRIGTALFGPRSRNHNQT